jgi:radical SAM protein with 4Fe4S-binding SPASM domain
MYILSLEIINACNLHCSYCYLGEKKNKVIVREVAEKAINIAVHEATKQNDKKLEVYFIGGEPLLAFEDMVYYVGYVKKNCEINNLTPSFSTTTNTLLTESIMRFLIKNRFSLKISIDGTEKAHDLNRKYYDGRNSYDTIISKLPLVKQYEKETGMLCHVAQVITPNNCRFFFDGFKNLRKLGFSFVESGTDAFSYWDDISIEILENQLKDAFCFYKELKSKKEQFYWKMIEDLIRELYTPVPFYSCKAGLRTCYVTVEGDIYPCTEIDKRVKIGTTQTGLNAPKIRNFVGLHKSENSECLECLWKDHCKASGCIMNNYNINRDFFKPVFIECTLTKYLFSMIKNNISPAQNQLFKKYFGEVMKKHVS